MFQLINNEVHLVQGCYVLEIDYRYRYRYHTYMCLHDMHILVYIHTYVRVCNNVIQVCAHVLHVE